MVNTEPHHQHPEKWRWFWTAFLLVLISAFSIRVVAAVAWQSRQASANTFAWGDSKTYWQIAENIVQHGDYSFGTPPKRIFRAPGYCGFLAIEMWVSQSLTGQPLSVTAARWSGALLGTLAVAAMALWVRQQTQNDRAALLTAIGLAVYPGAIAMSIFVLAEALFVPVMVLALWTWTRSLQTNQKGEALLGAFVAGMLHGQAVLIRPSWLLFPAFATGCLLILGNQRRRTLFNAFVVALAMMLAMSPWWYRNYQLTGRFIPTTLQVGASLYDGWNPDANGASDMTHGYRIEDDVRRQVLQKGIQEGWDDDQIAIQQELAASDALGAAAKQWASQNPLRFVQLFFTKVARTWRPWPVAEESGSRLTRTMVGISLILIVALALPQWRRLPQLPWLMLMIPTLYFTILHGVFVGSVRYRQPAVFLLVPFAALTLARCWPSKVKQRDPLPVETDQGLSTAGE